MNGSTDPITPSSSNSIYLHLFFLREMLSYCLKCLEFFFIGEMFFCFIREMFFCFPRNKDLCLGIDFPLIVCLNFPLFCVKAFSPRALRICFYGVENEMEQYLYFIFCFTFHIHTLLLLYFCLHFYLHLHLCLDFGFIDPSLTNKYFEVAKCHKRGKGGKGGDAEIKIKGNFGIQRKMIEGSLMVSKDYSGNDWVLKNLLYSPEWRISRVREWAKFCLCVLQSHMT